jgi:phosphopantothenoylcysteine synthetase/decarboxylase
MQGIEKIVTLSADDNASGEDNQPPPTLSGAKGVQVWIFPAMNTFMYQHPLTERHLSVIQGVLKYRVVGPIGTC